MRRGDIQPQLIIQLLHGLPGHPRWELHRAGRTESDAVLARNLAEPDGAVQLHRCHPLDTTHRVMGTRTSLNAPSALGPISRARARAPLHPRDTTLTRTGRRRRPHAARGHTTPTHHPTPPRTGHPRWELHRAGRTESDAVLARNWQNQTGQSSCIDAHTGHYASGYGNTNSLNAPSALGPISRARARAPCIPGHYVDTNGSTTQTPCGAGTYNPNSGSSDFQIASGD